MSVSNEVLALISQVAQKQVSANEELLSTGLIDSVSAMDLVMAIKQNLMLICRLSNWLIFWQIQPISFNMLKIITKAKS